MIFLEQPTTFNKKFDVASCFIECDGKILFLLRQDHKPQGNTWCLPAGKIDAGEQVLQGLMREVKEETNFELVAAATTFLGKVFVSHDNYDFVYHMFKHKAFNSFSPLINTKEHKSFNWFTAQEALALKNLMPDEDSCIKLYYPV